MIPCLLAARATVATFSLEHSVGDLRDRKATLPQCPFLPVGVVARVKRPDTATDKQLTVTVLPHPEDGVVVLHAVGEIDLATVGRLRDRLHTQVPGAYRVVIVDCTGVSFLAACGIGLLIETADRALAEGMALWLVANGRVVLRALEVTGVDKLIPHASTVAQAVTQCSI
jgi:anti-sigma B factor antagonist